VFVKLAIRAPLWTVRPEQIGDVHDDLDLVLTELLVLIKVLSYDFRRHLLNAPTFVQEKTGHGFQTSKVLGGWLVGCFESWLSGWLGC